MNHVLDRLDEAASERLDGAASEMLLRGAWEVPRLPVVVVQLLQGLRDPDADATSVAELVRSDPALSSLVIGLANPVGARTRVEDLRSAVLRVGHRSLGEMALALGIRGRLLGTPAVDATVRTMWGHAVGTGLWCREIEGEIAGSRAFQCGFVSLIGRPIALRVVCETAAALPIPFPGVERVLPWVERNYMAASARCCEVWGLPDDVVDVAKNHPIPRNSATGIVASSMVHLGATFAAWMRDPRAWRETAIRTSPASATLALDRRRLDALFARRMAVVEAVDRVVGGTLEVRI